MQITTQGLILRETSIDDDRLLTILTKDMGVLSAYARGAKGIKGKMVSSTELLCYSRFVLFKNREKYYIDSVDSERVFFGIRQDIEKLSLASYMAELMTNLAPKDENSDEYLKLILNSLHMLEGGKKNMLLIKAIFELRLISLAGYMPNLVACRECAVYEDEKMLFISRTGEIVCGKCTVLSEEGTPIHVPPSILAAMRHIIYSPNDKLFAFTLPDDACKRLSQTTEQYTMAQMGYKLATLDFFQTIYLG